jgi:ubiquinone biosynthesis protein COQ4
LNSVLIKEATMELSRFSRAALQEESAARIVDSGSRLRRFWLGLVAGLRLLRDPRDTQQVFVLATAVDRPRLHLQLAQFRKLPEGRALLRERAAINSQSVDFARLRKLPADTLGGAYVRMLERERLDPDLFQPPPLLSPELTYLVQRIRQTHDVWHVVTGLSTSLPDEVALQAFTNAQLHNSTSRLIVLFGTLVYGLRYPQLRGRVRAWRSAGSRCAFLLTVRWEELWEVPLDQLRERLGLIVPELLASAEQPGAQAR